MKQKQHVTRACRIGVGADGDDVAGASIPSSVAKMASFHSKDTVEIPWQKLAHWRHWSKRMGRQRRGHFRRDRRFEPVSSCSSTIGPAASVCPVTSGKIDCP